MFPRQHTSIPPENARAAHATSPAEGDIDQADENKSKESLFDSEALVRGGGPLPIDDLEQVLARLDQLEDFSVDIHVHNIITEL